MDKEPIVIVCACDDKYAMPLTVAVRSALENLNKNRSVILFIMDGGICPGKKQRIVSSLKSHRLQLKFMQCNEAILEKLPILHHFKLPAYYRLLIPQVLPAKFKKVIYLDSDLVVNGDLAQLWDIDIGDNYVLAVQDLGIPYVSSPLGLRNYQDLSLPPDYKYFNSGVLVINLDLWRTDSMSTKTINYIEQNRNQVQFPDQDGLNAILAGRWRELDLKWNQIPKIYDYLSWKDSPFDEDVYNALIHNPYIIHFAGPGKPWHSIYNHPKKDSFFYYVNMTAWAGLRQILFFKRLARLFLQSLSSKGLKMVYRRTLDSVIDLLFGAKSVDKTHSN